MKLTNRSAAILILVGVLAVLTLGTAWLLGVGPLRSSNRNPVIATVDGRPIYLDEARSRVRSLAGMHEGSQGPLSGSDWHDQVLQSLVDDQLIREEADRQGIAVTDQEIASAVQDVIDLFPTLAEYQTWLTSEQMDQGDVEDRMELQIISTRVFEAVTSDVHASDAQLREHYEANTASYAADDGEPATFSEARADVRDDVEQQMKDEAFISWLDDQRRSASVEVILAEWWSEIDEQQS
jgi:parvulin-like peptidyl-prolyl isomerase